MRVSILHNIKPF